MNKYSFLLIGIFVFILLAASLFTAQYIYSSPFTRNSASSIYAYRLNNIQKNEGSVLGIMGKKNETSFENLMFGNRKSGMAGFYLSDKNGVEMKLEVDKKIQNGEVMPVTSKGKDGEAIVTYEDIAKDTDLIYKTTTSQIKEEIIINTREAAENTESYTFNLNIQGLSYEKNEDNTVIPTFTSIKDKETTYTIPPAFMIDSKGAKSYGVTTKITEDITNPNNLIIELTPNKIWLTSQDRQFPIIIDPTLVKGNPPIASWFVDEGQGSTTKDASTNANTLTITNAVWQVDQTNSGNFVGAKFLRFDGSGDYVSRAYDSDFDFGTGSFTISMWIRVPTVAIGTDMILARYSGAGFKIYLNQKEYLCFGIDADSSWTPTDSVCTTTPYNDSKWHHIEAVKESTNSISLYVDGILMATNTNTSADGSISGTSPVLYIGIDSDATSNSYQGDIDQIAIFNYARDANQIKSDAFKKSQTSASFGGRQINNLKSGLIGWWKLDDATWNGTANEVVDSSGQGYHGTSEGVSKPTIVAGKFEKAGSFDGTSKNLNLKNNLGQAGQTFDDITISVWVNTNSNTTKSHIFGREKGTGGVQLVLQPGPRLGNDAITDSSYPTQTHESDNDLYTGTRAPGSGYPGGPYRSLLKFDLSSIPSTATLTDSNLRIYGYNYEGNSFVFYRATSDWNESTVTWNTLPTYDSGTAHCTINTNAYRTYTAYNCTALDTLISSWISGSNANYGFYIRGNSESDWTRDFFASSDNPTASYRPQLTVDYTTANSAGMFYLEQGDGADSNKTLFTYHDANDTVITVTGKQLQQASWENVVIVKNSTLGKLSIYQNGVLTGETVATTDIPALPANFYIGKCIGTTGCDFNGKIDELRVYDRALSDKEVKDLYNWSPEPFVYYDLNENSGTSTVYDKSGNSYTGTMNGSMTAADWIPGKFGSALNFDGSDDYLDLSSAAGKINESSGTIMAWVKPRTTQSHTILTTGASGGGSHGIYFDTNVDVFRVSYRNDGWATEGLLQSTTTFSGNDWHHLAATWSNNLLNLYIDGVLEGSGALTQLISNQDFIVAGAYASEYVGPEDNFDGDIDEIKLYDYVRTQGQIVEDMNGGHPVGGSPVGSQVGYWKFNEGYGDSANDWSPQNVDGDLSGSTSCPNATICPTWTNSGKFGKGIYFGGLQTADGDSHVRLADNVYDTQTQGTISMWIKPDDSGDAGQSILGVAEDDNNGWSDVFSIEYVPADNMVGLYLIDNTSMVTALYAVINPSVWNHIVYVANETSDTTTVYVNGVAVESETGAYWFSDVSENTTAYTLGCVNIDGSDANDCSDSNLYQGYLDEVKIYSTPLTESQIKTEYLSGKSNVMGAVSTASDGKTADFSASREHCVPGDTGTCNSPVAHWKFDEGTGTSTVYDSSGNGYSGSMNGSMTESDWVPGKNGKGLDFDGSDDRIEITHNSNLNGSTNMVISAWIKLRDYNTSWASMIAEKKANSAAGWQFFVRGTIDGTNQKKMSFNMDDGANDNYVFADTELQLNTWYHVAIDYNDTANTLTFYVNGKPDGTRSISASPSSNTSAMSIGGFSLLEPNGYLYDFNGVIDDVKIYNYSRTLAQIAWEYNRGAPVAHYKFDECTGTTIKDWAKNANGTGTGNNGTLTLGASPASGSCTTSGAWYNGANGQFGTSIDFDGSDDYVDSNTDDLFDFGTNDFTVTAWVNPDDTNASGRIVSKMATTNTAGFDLMLWGGYANPMVNNTWDVASTNKLYAAGEWAQIAWVKSGTNSVVYKNGIIDATWTNTPATITANAATLKIGSGLDSAFFFDGKIDDVRIYNYALNETQLRAVYNDSAAVKFK